MTIINPKEKGAAKLISSMVRRRAAATTEYNSAAEKLQFQQAGEDEAIAQQPQQQEDDDDIVSWFEGIAENAGVVQAQTLKRIIQINCNTAYLNKWLNSNNNKIEDMEAETLEAFYTSSVPLSSHADVEPYIRRIADGDDSPLLTRQPITMLSLSSGTTDGRQKYVPFTPFSSRSTLQIFRLAAAYRSRVFPIRGGGRVLEFIYSSKQFQTKGGLTAGTATTHYFASEEFKTKQKSTRSFTCSPYEVISCGDYKQSTYCHLLLGLLFSDQVEFVASTFAYSLVQAFADLEEVWQEIVEDIRHATLSPRITWAKMRRAVLESCSSTAALNIATTPDPRLVLASDIERKCKELKSVDWHGVIPTLWPNAKYIYSIMTGSMQPYLRKLRHYAGGVPLVCADYGSTESWIGVNLRPSDPPERVNFTVIPTFSYFEFIPLSSSSSRSNSSDYQTSGDDDKDDRRHDRSSMLNATNHNDNTIDDFEEGEPVPLSKVKLGGQYEVVLTTFTGLYRYRLGDVVEVAGFYKGTPQLNFICRRKLILTINIDKNTEKDLQLVVERGSSLLSQKSRAELADFTSHADVSHHPGHYVIYWEIIIKKNNNIQQQGHEEEDDGSSDIDNVLQECCQEMDAAFVDHGYVVSRKTNSIGPLELRIVEKGTFRRILDHYIGNGAAMSQFKTPRCTSNQALLKILNNRTVKHFTSTAYSGCC